MLQLQDIANVLRAYGDRYRYLDVFADDIRDLPQAMEGTRATVVQREPHLVLAVPMNGDSLLIELYPPQGIARCRLGAIQEQGVEARAAMILGGTMGALLGAASATKEGLLGGLVLGMLVGGLVGGMQPPVDRVLAMQFDPANESWRLYDGPLLRWAKRTMQPTA